MWDHTLYPLKMDLIALTCEVSMFALFSGATILLNARLDILETFNYTNY